MTPDPAQVDVAIGTRRVHRPAVIPPCSVDGCGRPVKSRGVCSTHHYRLTKFGDVHHKEDPPSGPERLWSNVLKTETCWLWQGSRVYGYGTLMVAGRNLRAHRYAWELLRGPIPDDLVLDHVCRVRHCVNPDHLELVTDAINVLRGIGPSAINARKTHCIHGHEFTPENTYTPPGKPNRRTCRECMRARRSA